MQYEGLAVRWIVILACSTLLMACTELESTRVSTEAASDGQPKLLNPKKVPVGVPPADLLKSVSGGVLKSVSGEVLLQFRLDNQGKPQDVRVVLAEPNGEFERHSRILVSKMRFSLPPEWVASHPKRIHEVAFVYRVNRCLPTNPFPGVDTIMMQAWLRSPEIDKIKAACNKQGESSSPAKVSAQ